MKNITRGRGRSQRRTGSLLRMTTASRARLVLANATMLPNRIISGSFSNWATPDIVMTRAIDTAAITVVPRVAANVAAQSAGPGVPVMLAKVRTISREIDATNMKLP